MKKLILLLITALTAHAANYDLRYLQENSSGKIVERTVTLTPSTFLSVSANGTLQVQSSTDFRTSLGLGTAATSNSTAFLASSNGTATNLTLNGTTTFGNATQARAALGLGTLATQNGTFSGTSSGNNTGDQTLSGLGGVASTNGTATNLTVNGTTTFGNATQVRSALALGTLATQNGTFSGTSSGNNTGDQTLSGLGGVASTNGTATNLTVNGTLTASLNGTQITTGTLAAARLPNLTLNLSGALYNTPVTFTDGVGNATFANQTANTVFAGPSSGNATAPTFRALTSSDLPTITLNLSGTLHNTPVTFTAGVGNATLANQSANTFFAGPSSGNATTPTFRALTNGDIPSSLALSGNLSNNGTATFGDAAADEFSATDDDPRFPNLTAATYTAAADNKVAINGDVGDARYGPSSTGFPLPLSFATRSGGTNLLSDSVNSGLRMASVGGNVTTGNKASARLGGFMSVYGSGGNTLLGQKWILTFDADLGVDAANPLYLGVYAGTQSNGTLTGKGVAVVVIGPSTIQLQIHNGSTLATQDFTVANIANISRRRLLIQWDGASVLSVSSGTVNGSLSSVGSLTSGISGQGSSAELEFAATAPATAVPNQFFILRSAILFTNL